jgi:hypothetical protein
MRTISNLSDDTRLRYSLRWHVVPVNVRCWFHDSPEEEPLFAIAHAVRLRDSSYSGLIVDTERGLKADGVVDLEAEEIDLPYVEYAMSLWLITIPNPDSGGNRWVPDQDVFFTYEAVRQAGRVKKQEAEDGEHSALHNAQR